MENVLEILNLCEVKLCDFLLVLVYKICMVLDVFIWILSFNVIIIF